MLAPRTFTVMLAALAVALAPLSLKASLAEDAGNYAREVGDLALSVITNKKLTRTQKQVKLEKIFAANVDIPWIGRFVLGRFWRQATDEQKALYLKKYERFLVMHYTSRFADYTQGSFTITEIRQDGDGEFTVSMQMQPGERPGEEPVLVDYRVRKDGGSFKIFDIIVEGVSMITTQRSEFNSVLSSHGLDYLIDQLDKKSSAGTAGRD